MRLSLESDDSLVLYQFHISPYCGKVRAVLHHKGLTYETRPVHVVDRRKLLWVSRQRKVPALVHDGKVIVDSTAIVRYLEETWPLPAVYPRGRRDRAQALLWEDWADESLQRVIGPLKFLDRGNARAMHELEQRHSSPSVARGFARLAPVVKLQMGLFGGTFSVSRLHDRLEELITMFSDRLQGLYLVGDRPTIADFAVFAVLEPFENLNGWSVVAGHANVLEWFDRVKAAAAPKIRVPAEKAAPQA